MWCTNGDTLNNINTTWLLTVILENTAISFKYRDFSPLILLSFSSYEIWETKTWHVWQFSEMLHSISKFLCLSTCRQPFDDVWSTKSEMHGRFHKCSDALNLVHFQWNISMPESRKSNLICTCNSIMSSFRKKTNTKLCVSTLSLSRRNEKYNIKDRTTRCL